MPDISSPASSVSSGYVSDAELIAWLESKQTRQNEALRDQMEGSTTRQDLIADLTNLKTDIDRATTPEDVDAIKAKMQELLDSDKYASYTKELSALFDPALTALEHPDATDLQEVAAITASDGIALGDLKDRITTQTNQLDKIDGLALIDIQQAVADMKETQQLASNVLSSREQTAGSIVGNIRG